MSDTATHNLDAAARDLDAIREVATPEAVKHMDRMINDGRWYAMNRLPTASTYAIDVRMMVRALRFMER